MGLRTIRWKTRASRKNLEILLWYRTYMGNDAAMNYFNDVIETVETLAKMPTIGREEKGFSKGKIFIIHF